MEDIIKEEIKDRKLNEIIELNVKNCKSDSICGLTEDFSSLETLNLSGIGLTTLKGFPKLPNLKKLDISDNKISDGLQNLSACLKLQHLDLSNNKIDDIENLKPLEALKNLSSLTVANNAVATGEKFRDQVFKMLPSLVILDGLNLNETCGGKGDATDAKTVNGNDSDDEGANFVYHSNGIDIDLDEFEAYERRLREKKALTDRAAKSLAEETDELDELLSNIRLKEKESSTTTTPANANEAGSGGDGVVMATIDRNDLQRQPPSATALLLLIYWFYSLLSVLDIAVFSDATNENDEEKAADGDEENEDDDDDEDGEEAGSDDSIDDDCVVDVPLNEVYNDNLEDDNSDWEVSSSLEEDDVEDSDDDVDVSTASSTADTSAAEKNDTKDSPAADESASKGKKRKRSTEN